MVWHQLKMTSNEQQRAAMTRNDILWQNTMYFRYSEKILNQESISSKERRRKWWKTQKNSIFFVYRQKCAWERQFFKIVILQVTDRFLIQIIFGGLTNISNCRKLDFSIGGRFSVAPRVHTARMSMLTDQGIHAHWKPSADRLKSSPCHKTIFIAKYKKLCVQ